MSTTKKQLDNSIAQLEYQFKLIDETIEKQYDIFNSMYDLASIEGTMLTCLFTELYGDLGKIHFLISTMKKKIDKIEKAPCPPRNYSAQKVVDQTKVNDNGK